MPEGEVRAEQGDRGSTSEGFCPCSEDTEAENSTKVLVVLRSGKWVNPNPRSLAKGKSDEGIVKVRSGGRLVPRKPIRKRPRISSEACLLTEVT